MPAVWCDCCAFYGFRGDGVRVFVYFDYNEYHSIRKWMQRHPEYSGSIFSNDGFYIAKFDIDATDSQNVAYFFNYFSKKDVELFKMKKLIAWEILKKFEIISFKPFIARAKSQDLRQKPGNEVKASGGILESVPVVETDMDQDEQTSSHLFSSRNPREASASHSFSGSGDTYEYYPERRDYE